MIGKVNGENVSVNKINELNGEPVSGSKNAKLDYTINTKSDIADAIESKGVEVSSNDTFRSYGDKVRSIQTGVDKNYTHVQSTASDTWVIEHDLNKYPAVSIIDSAGDEVTGDITYDNLNQVTIKFVGAFKGTATLN